MPKLTILSNRIIRSKEDYYSLDDIHLASGGSKRYKPELFLETKQTLQLIKEIEQCESSNLVAKTQGGGKHTGTWVRKELVYAYAIWISPKFHLLVIRAFDDQLITSRKPYSQTKTIELPDVFHQRILLTVTEGKITERRLLSGEEQVMNRKAFINYFKEPDVAFNDIDQLTELSRIVNERICIAITR
ncbi:KilA-N domain-containing protein [Vibrio sp. CB1-14]|uniref:KilA-N domain-containing protein n=1 Tax=Vibrio chaetopteri TaxID=3016528 RepID=A0AAU8BPD6_9VIBR